MTDQDKENLRFLLESTPESLHVWFQDQNEDDIEYAQGLLDVAAEELRIRSIDLIISAKPSYTEAKAALSKIMKL
jgi:hypothetical protein